MERLDPSSVLVLPGVQDVLAALGEARIVGGAVRDLLAGLPVRDVDIATPLTPNEVTAALGAAGIRAIPTGIAHGTITAALHGATIEVTTLRRDVETDGRHAVVAFTDDWTADAARRDFTINAMSMAADGTLHDYFGGCTDLAEGRLRFVGEAAARIAEDYLRILRFFRFQARYARRLPDVKTARALSDGAPKLIGLSAERLWSELSKILAVPDPAPILGLMSDLAVLPVLLPGSDETLATIDRLVAAKAPAEPVLRLAALLPGRGVAAETAARLKLSNAERERLLALLDGPLPAPDADGVTLRRALADIPEDLLTGRSFLRHEPVVGGPLFRDHLAAIEAPIFPLKGADALSLGLPPGPAIGEALRIVREWWLAQGCPDDADACRTELARVVGRPSS
ncbi:CCA tRNA nucleotidyltransferase [Acidisoma cladoniae]|uniref:CCA tRNA nucleotidyltransferase n=1 Tax=Acidisoma cladoniae TaxID=3040935 RepID=UPI00254AB059|nr:CCA tRNA nucleotidyltransferase [Acidisoma sp. PAMC 29798]